MSHILSQNTDVADKKASWPVVGFGMIVGISLVEASLLLPCLCYSSIFLLKIYGLLMSLTIFRYLYAVFHKQHDKGWIFYCGFLFLLPWLLFLADLIWGRF